MYVLAEATCREAMTWPEVVLVLGLVAVGAWLLIALLRSF